MKQKLLAKPCGLVAAYFNLLMLVALLGGFTAQADPLGTVFTYQGQLQTDSGPANGLYDLRFRLFNAATLGAPVVAPVTNSAVVLSNGYFTVTLDFGAAFTQARWLDIGVRTNGSNASFTLLTPRQAITPTPNAIVASQLAGSLADAQLGTNVALLDRNNQVFSGNNAFAGNVGIGTTSPSERLHVVASSGTEVRVENTGSGNAGLGLVNADREYSVRMTQGENLVLRDVTAGNADRLTIITNGNVGIGTTSPTDTLQVNGGVTATTFTGSGAGLTGLSASQITTGTLADAQLDANVALLNRNNQVFSGNNAFAGNVGIGTTSPSERLHVVASSGTEVRVENTGSGSAGLGLVNADREYSVRMTQGENLVLRDVTAGNADRLTIITNGNVGIGTSSPNALVHIWNDGTSYTPLRYETAGTSGPALSLKHTGTGGKEWLVLSQGSFNGTAGNLSIRDETDGFDPLTITPTGFVGIGTTSPTERLHVAGSGTPGIRVENLGSGTAGIQLTDTDQEYEMRLTSGNKLSFFDITAGSLARLTLDQTGNLGIGTTTPGTALDVAGEITCVAINITSDRNAKEGFQPVSPRAVLDKLARLPITEWEYKTQPNSRHMGPMAQDFRATFALGHDDKHIASVDADGVALAAIQGLNQKLEEQAGAVRERDAELKQLQAENQSLAERLAAIEQILGLRNGSIPQ